MVLTIINARSRRHSAPLILDADLADPQVAGRVTWIPPLLCDLQRGSGL
jgi:hypothetical protein